MQSGEWNSLNGQAHTKMNELKVLSGDEKSKGSIGHNGIKMTVSFNAFVMSPIMRFSGCSMTDFNTARKKMSSCKVLCYRTTFK